MSDLSASGVLTSGLAAPARTATPYPTRAMLAGVPANLPRAVVVLHHVDGHNAEVERAGRRHLDQLGRRRKRHVKLVASPFSKRGPSSFRLAVIEPPAMTFSSAAFAAEIGDMRHRQAEDCCRE